MAALGTVDAADPVRQDAALLVLAKYRFGMKRHFGLEPTCTITADQVWKGDI